VAREDLTVTVYKDQFAELDNDLKNGVISQEQFDQAKRDIERNLLADMKLLKDGSPVETATRSKTAWVAVAVVGLFVPVSAVMLYGKWGAGEAGLNPQAATPQVSTDQHNANLQEMVAELEAKLQAEPNDGEGWVMLARSYQFMKRYDDAVKAFERVVALGGGQDPNVLATFADAVAMASGRRLTPRSVSLLDQALAVDPNHIKALWLRGTAAYQDQDYVSALKYWERLYAALPPGSEEAQTIAGNVMEVKSLLGMPATPPTALSGSLANDPTAASGGNAVIKGTVTLAGAVASRVQPDDTVFVFARAATGPRMPLAIVRKQVKDIPFDFNLDDSMAMNPQMKLSNFSEVVVGARISKTGDAMPKPGDLEGYSQTMKVATAAPVNVVINKIIP
jgi:cytochrome c-type biogenesis protein CcmH